MIPNNPFEMNEREFYGVLQYLAEARDEFDNIGLTDKAKECDRTIALFQEIELIGVRRPKGDPKRLC